MTAHESGQEGLTLIELLVAITIMAVVSAMIVLSWTSLQKSYSFTTKSDKQREFARDAVARISREIRDVKGAPGVAPVVAAEPDTFSFYSGFNVSDQLPAAQPIATLFTYVPADQTIYRQRDSDDPDSSAENEPRTAIMTNVINGSTPVFSYVIYEGGGQAAKDLVTGPDMQSIVSVEIHVVTDLNPGRSPDQFDLRTSAQLRNLRLH